MARRHRADVDVRERVAGDHEERLAREEVLAVAHSAGGPEELGLKAVGDAVAEIVTDRIGEVMEVRDDFVRPVPLEEVEDVRHHGPVEDGHHRLGDLVGERTQTRAEARSKNHRLHRKPSYRIGARSPARERPYPQALR